MANQVFHASRHLSAATSAGRERPRVYTMQELGHARDTGISAVAVSKPFELFTREAIRAMRREALSPAVRGHHSFSSNLAPLQLRGYVPEYAPFITKAWKSKEVLDIISRIAGIDLVPVCDYEIGHVNLSPPVPTSPGHGRGAAEPRPVVDWHVDAYPFVCIVMLSDPAPAHGGETLIRAGKNIPTLRIRSPGSGCAVVLQGRHLEHKALPAIGNAERVTMVTAFRPRSPSVPLNMSLATVRPVSDLRPLYHQYVEYRLESLEARVKRELRRHRENGSRHFHTSRAKSTLKALKDMITRTEAELVDEAHVRMGEVPEAPGH